MLIERNLSLRSQIEKLVENKDQGISSTLLVDKDKKQKNQQPRLKKSIQSDKEEEAESVPSEGLNEAKFELVRRLDIMA